MNLAQAIDPEFVQAGCPNRGPHWIAHGNLLRADIGRGLHVAPRSTEIRIADVPRIDLDHTPGWVLEALATFPDDWWKPSELAQRAGCTVSAAANGMLTLHARGCAEPDRPSAGAGNRTHRRWRVTKLGLRALAVALARLELEAA